MARSKKGRAGKAAQYKAVVNGTGTARYTSQHAIASSSYLLPKVAAVQNFSLADEARHTAHNHSDPASLGSLRGRPVTFVSAGVVEPLKELDNELLASNENRKPEADIPLNLVKDLDKVNSAGIDAIAVTRDSQQPVVLDAATADSPTGEEAAAFFIDVAGDKSLAQRREEPAVIHNPRPRSPSSSGSSSGADHVVFKGRNPQDQQQQHRTVVDEMTIQVQSVEKTMQHISLDSDPMHSTQRKHTPPIPAWQLRGHSDDDDLVADYIANMDNDDDEDDDDDDVQQQLAKFQPSFGARDLGGADGDFVVAEDSDSDASSDDDAEDQVARDEAPVLEIPEAEEAAFAAAGASDEIDDEALARSLAKQEEFGIDEDELVVTSEEMAHYNNRFVAKSNSMIDDYRQSKETTWKSGKKGAHSMIPSASAVADYFDDMAMDWNRHNPPRKAKCKRGQPTFDVSDSELEAHLQAIFNKDRLRKKERKLEREELRAAGLLGKHGKPGDLRIKYPAGINIEQIKAEMRIFLQGDNETLTFPPMDSNARKSIHEICIRLNVKSKSTGGGDQRRPILHRTKRTGIYREAAFEAAFAHPGRRFMPRLDVNKSRGGRGGGGGGSAAKGRGVNSTAFTYRDGEVVGGGAPELAANNKGRALMEKMGWSSGMALGADDNQGILQPVPHVVKRTKAGLG